MGDGVRELRLVVAAVIAPPVVTPWQSLDARLDAPAGLQLTLLEDLGED